MARKQVVRALPSDWPVEISFAGHGQEALEALKQGLGEVMFLDLTMPIMDGFETLQAIKDQQLDVLVIVISGDIQPEAHRRVMALGAMEFIKKPAEPETVIEVLSRFGLYKAGEEEDKPLEVAVDAVTISGQTTDSRVMDCYRELTNVAMGRAGDLLARLTGTFVQLPVPKVNILEVSELEMALNFAQDESVSAVCQGFIGIGVAGEALLLFSESSFEDMARLMGYKSVEEHVELEVLTDLSGVLLGAVLNGLGEQLDINFSQGYPSVLGLHTPVSDLINANIKNWRRTLTIEVTYHIENYNIVCDLLLLFTEDSVTTMNKRMSYLLD